MALQVLYKSSAAEDSTVLAGIYWVDEIQVTNVGGSDRYVNISDAATLPADATAPDIVIGVPSGQTVSWRPEPSGVGKRGAPFNLGVAVNLSSTGATKTVTTGSEAAIRIFGTTKEF